MADVENSLEFVQAVKLDLCTALGISAPRIQVHGLRGSSVLVDMTVLEGQPETDRSPRFVRRNLPTSSRVFLCLMLHIYSFSETLSFCLQRNLHGNAPTIERPLERIDARCYDTQDDEC